MSPSPLPARDFCGLARARLPSAYPLKEKRLDFADRDSLLLHRIPLPNRNRTLIGRSIFANGVEIHGNPKRRSRFVLSAVAPANCPGLVIKNHHVGAQDFE